jgi:protein-S-isoprenylcysteine O-methyltransferase Ste14
MLRRTMEAMTKGTVPGTGAADSAGPAALPKAPTSMLINLAGIAAFVGAIAWLHNFGQRVRTLDATLLSIGAFAVTVIVLEAVFLRTWRRSSTGFDFARAGEAHYLRALGKLLGFYLTLALGLCIYVLFPEYRGGFYESFYRMLWRVLPVVAVVAAPYFLVLERFNKRPFDGFWQTFMLLRPVLRPLLPLAAALAAFGLAIARPFTGRPSRGYRKLLPRIRARFEEECQAVDRRVLGQHALGWLVKTFFTPLMFIYCQGGIERLRFLDYGAVFSSTGFGPFFDFTIDTFYNIDVILAVTGYLLTVRLFDSHIRSTEPSLLGWGVALMCYQPFWGFIEGNYLNYGSGGATWGSWFGGNPLVYKIWGSIILLLIAVYLWATTAFGIRFSNLTHRGILTNGPYRFTKHPAYVSKNLSWWLISMPFLSHAGWQVALQCSLKLLLLNLAYFMRARTEERHLSRDPDYVAYATAMEQRGVFRWVGRLLPAVRFKPERLFNV